MERASRYTPRIRDLGNSLKDYSLNTVSGAKEMYNSGFMSLRNMVVTGATLALLVPISSSSVGGVGIENKPSSNSGPLGVNYVNKGPAFSPRYRAGEVDITLGSGRKYTGNGELVSANSPEVDRRRSRNLASLLSN